MPKAIDNPTLKAELWKYAETLKADDLPVIREFKTRLKQIPQETRQSLEELWRAHRRQSPRHYEHDEGKIGLFVVDHLWVVFSNYNFTSGDADGVDLMKLFSPGYAEAMCKALGIDNANS